MTSSSSAIADAAQPAADVARRGSQFLVLALLATLLLWNLPYGWYALYPFKVFATWLHESSHGLVMMVSGAGFAEMKIFSDTSGLAFPRRGVGPVAQVFVSSAGYMGTAFFGAVFLVVGRTARGARAVLAGLGAILALSAALYVRNGFGVAAVLVGGAVLLLTAWRGNDDVRRFVVSFVAAQSCINAVFDIKVLFAPTMYVNGMPQRQSDAHVVASLLGGPHWLWAVVWLVWSFALFYGALRWLRVRGA